MSEVNVGEDVTLRLHEGGDVTIEGLGGISYSDIHIEHDHTEFRMKGHRLRIGWHGLELFRDDNLVYRETW